MLITYTAALLEYEVVESKRYLVTSGFVFNMKLHLKENINIYINPYINQYKVQTNIILAIACSLLNNEGLCAHILKTYPVYNRDNHRSQNGCQNS